MADTDTDADADVTWAGAFAYVIGFDSLDNVYCGYLWPANGESIDPCPDCEYGLGITGVGDDDASSCDDAGLGNIDGNEYYWAVSYDEDYYIDGYGYYPVMWYYFPDYGSWYPITLAYSDGSSYLSWIWFYEYYAAEYYDYYIYMAYFSGYLY